MPSKSGSSSELWLDGEMCTRAELTRSKFKYGAEKELGEVVKERSKAGYDAGHWYWQPVGGRSVRSGLAPQGPEIQQQQPACVQRLA